MQETPKKKVDKTPKGKKKDVAPNRGRKKPVGEPVVEATGVTSPDSSTMATTSPLKPTEKPATTPVKAEVCEVKKADSEFKITSPRDK